MLSIAVQLVLQHAILVEEAINKEWQHHGGEECRCKPGAERDAARSDNEEAGAVTRMADERVWPARDDPLPPVGLNTRTTEEKNRFTSIAQNTRT